MATIQKWGDSLAVKIPTRIAEQFHAREGTLVDIRSESGKLVITPQGTRPRYRLEDLLKDCRPEQLHGEIDFGPDVGREVLDE